MESIYKKYDLDERTDSSSLVIIRMNLLGLIDEHVLKRHLKEVEYQAITLHEVFSLIMDESILDRGRKFHLFNLIEHYRSKSLERFCDKYCDFRQSCAAEDESWNTHCKLKEVIDELNQENEAYEKFIRLVNPHVNVEINEHHRDDFKTTDTNFLYGIISNQLRNHVNNSMGTLNIKSGDSYFLPTTISSTLRQLDAATEEYCEIIRNNEYVLEKLFETNCFITDNIAVEDVFSSFSNVGECDPKKQVKYKVQVQNGFMDLKVSLMKIDDVIGVIDDEEVN